MAFADGLLQIFYSGKSVFSSSVDTGAAISVIDNEVLQEVYKEQFPKIQTDNSGDVKTVNTWRSFVRPGYVHDCFRHSQWKLLMHVHSGSRSPL